MSMMPSRSCSLNAGITTERKTEGGSTVGVFLSACRWVSFAAIKLSYQHGNGLSLLTLPLPSMEV